jgi:hypothetical protein
MRMPGVEPGSQAWEACMMPLHYMRHVNFQHLAVPTRIAAETPGASPPLNYRDLNFSKAALGAQSWRQRHRCQSQRTNAKQGFLEMLFVALW